MDAEELRGKEREYKARQPAQRCGVDGCEFQAKQKGNLKEHQARVHGIGDVDAEELRRKERERDRKRRRQSGESEDEKDINEEDEQHEVATVTRRSFRSAPTVNYAADTGSSSDDSSAKDQTKKKSPLKNPQSRRRGIGFVEAAGERRAPALPPPEPEPPQPPPAPTPQSPRHICCESGCGFICWTRWELDEHTESAHDCIDI
jgi:hypothetical protein